MIAANTVSRGKPAFFGAAGQHDGDDQRDFDHRHRDGQHQRAERLADAMRDYFGMMHGREHRERQRDGGQRHERGVVNERGGHKHDERENRGDDGPVELEFQWALHANQVKGSSVHGEVPPCPTRLRDEGALQGR